MGGMRARRAAAVAATCAVLAVTAACGAGGARSADPSVVSAPDPVIRTGVPTLRVEVVARGLEQVQDIGFLPNGQMLVIQQGGQLLLLSGDDPGAAIAPVAADMGDVWVRREAGLMGIVVHGDFRSSRRFTTCQTHAERGVPIDVRLVTWELSADGRSARRLVDPLVGGLPLSSSGRHAGCGPTIAADGSLLVGTGDATDPGEPQDLSSLGGKVLRVDLRTGGPPLGNPFSAEPDPALQLVLTFGHANVTGIAIDPISGTAYATDAGTGREDEINKLVAGQNYGWDPSHGGRRYDIYDRSTPGTDLVRYPTAIPAAWSSGAPAPGFTGAAFIDGRQWGDLNGRLAVTAGSDRRLLLMRIGPEGKIDDVLIPAELEKAFGELSGVRFSPAGELYVTTSNGTDDKVLRITPV
ncbi:MAG: PQQ-dependent sugar dehydrogenase [Pseudonocardia sp.]|nr:PQQ-dependent sugar dehydrogenase [Pseudonocardia sp.]